MAEFDYEVVNGRKIRVRPVETVSEVDENGYFFHLLLHIWQFPQTAKSFYKRIRTGRKSDRKRTLSSGLGKAVPLVKPCIHREGASGAGGCHQCQYGRTCAS